MSSEEKNKSSKIIGIIVGAIVFAAVSFSVKSCFLGDVTEEVKKVVKEMNAKTPMMVDEYTRLDSVALTSDRKFEYFYTISGMEITDDIVETVRKNIKSTVVSQLKTNPDMEAFRKNNLP
ncbi:hypothetical protein C8N46_102192 [Kordia periserrulae]|uniref:Uncharacterized protein n=1 Tax=Kordia periserrulae TaxID=701523 RepID=A0A2T6C392_9FLAO|nr:hypothetical protein [Kordia periserrulae]PTX62792.1 hypothetical protein C8N46_102192 [Kordia periserrulae]